MHLIILKVCDNERTPLEVEAWLIILSVLHIPNITYNYSDGTINGWYLGLNITIDTIKHITSNLILQSVLHIPYSDCHA